MTHRPFWLPLLAACLALATWLLGSLPARAADSGSYQIQHARYGTPEQNIDVTRRLRELASRDRVFLLGNDTFGVDPVYGQVKTLRIYARARDGREQIFEYREGQSVNGAQFTGWGGGNWGNDGWSGGWGGSGGSWGGGGSVGGGSGGSQWQILQARYGTAQYNVDVTRTLQEIARRDRQVRLSNDLFGTDPHFGAVKTLRIYARSGGQTRIFEIREGDVIDGSQFSGWSSGNWGGGGWNGGWGGSGGSSGTGGGFGGSGGSGGNQALSIVSASYGAGRQSMDVTRQLRSQIRDGRLEVLADNDLAGRDPAPNVQKVLRVTYSLGSQRMSREYRENALVRLP